MELWNAAVSKAMEIGPLSRETMATLPVPSPQSCGWVGDITLSRNFTPARAQACRPESRSQSFPSGTNRTSSVFRVRPIAAACPKTTGKASTCAPAHPISKLARCTRTAKEIASEQPLACIQEARYARLPIILPASTGYATLQGCQLLPAGTTLRSDSRSSGVPADPCKRSCPLARARGLRPPSISVPATFYIFPPRKMR